MGYRKECKDYIKDILYREKGIKHQHEFAQECVLEITNKNIHAAGNYYNKKEYYLVLKCLNCNSFISKREEGNIQGHLRNDFIKNDYPHDINMSDYPLITAETKMKCPGYEFSKLENVLFHDNNKKSYD